MRLALRLLGDVVFCVAMLYAALLMLGRGAGPVELVVLLAIFVWALVILIRKTLSDHGPRRRGTAH